MYTYICINDFYSLFLLDVDITILHVDIFILHVDISILHVDLSVEKNCK